MATVANEEGRRFLLLYGSQTGQAKAISEKIHEMAVERGLEPDMHCFSKSEKEFDVTKEPVVVIVVSTTGDGEAPDTVSKFWRKLKRKTVPETHLANVQYGLLGLGDTNYTNFCNMGKRLHKRMMELGATPFVEPGWADDGVGLELVVEPWIEDLWEPLEAALEQVHSPSNTQKDQLPSQNEGSDSSANTTSTSAIHGDAVNGEVKCSTVDQITESVNSEFTVSKSITVDKSVNPEFTDPVLKPSTADKITETAVSVNSEFTDSITQAPKTTQPSESSSDSTVSIVPEAAVGHVIDNGALCEVEKELKRVKLGSEPLSLPSIPPPSLSVKIEEASTKRVEFRYHDVEYVYGQTGGVTMATVVGCRQLTREGALRATIEVELRVQVSSVLIRSNILPLLVGSCLLFCGNVNKRGNLQIPKISAKQFLQVSFSSILPKISAKCVVSLNCFCTFFQRTKSGGFSYAPGDAVSFMCPNPAWEVELLVDRLGLMSCADHMKTTQPSESSSDSTVSIVPEAAVGHVIDNGALCEVEKELKRVKLGSEPLSLPSIPPPSLSVKIEEASTKRVEFRYHDVEYVYGQTGGVTMATVVGCRQLTREGALRATIEVELRVQSGGFSYAPGDAVSFMCPNPAWEVELLVDRLGLMSCADHMIQLQLANAQSSTGKSKKLLLLPSPSSNLSHMVSIFSSSKTRSTIVFSPSVFHPLW
jgi:sulfite reductase alpha subunit-like flavoprotein